MNTDELFLRHALHLAQHSSEPVPCGVVLVKNGEMIAQAYNSQRVDNQAVNHAEVKALQQANKQLGSRKLTNVTAYCSCEPCVMCLTALSLAKVKRIVYCQTMKEVAPDDPMASIDSVSFANQYLNFVPKLERLVVS